MAPDLHPTLDALAADARDAFAAGVDAVRPALLLARAGADLHARRPLAAYRRVVVAGLGKAALSMGAALADRLGGRLDGGVLVVPHGYAADRPVVAPALPACVRVVEADHPVPRAASAAAGAELLAVAAAAGADDLVVVLVSGGGTALALQPAPDVTTDDVTRTVDLLLRSGADIHAMNAVRRRLSRVGGGGLARAAAPAEVAAFVVSDVVGDDLEVIASGPTVQGDGTRADAAGVLRAHGLWTRVPASVRAYLERPGAGRGARGHEAERVRTQLVGANSDALDAAAARLAGRGYAAEVAGRTLTGEARAVGAALARAACARADGTPRALLWGGETTVTVRGDGRGGRNQELALAAALALDGEDRPVVLLSGGTDGRDGPTDAAGGWATPWTAAAGRACGLDPEDHLARNDAYPFLRAAGSLLVTGPTHTNVMDLVVALVR